MFDTYNDFDFKVNAVAGTLRKSHPQSKFCVRPINDDQWVFADGSPRLVYSGCDIVLLQIMLTGENRALIEYVDKCDFQTASEPEEAQDDA